MAGVLEISIDSFISVEKASLADLSPIDLSGYLFQELFIFIFLGSAGLGGILGLGCVGCGVGGILGFSTFGLFTALLILVIDFPLTLNGFGFILLI